jgi:hypothetical protein
MLGHKHRHRLAFLCCMWRHDTLVHCIMVERVALQPVKPRCTHLNTAKARQLQSGVAVSGEAMSLGSGALTPRTGWHTSAVCARPPTRWLPSRIVACQRPAPLYATRCAAASPAKPAPMMMTFLAAAPSAIVPMSNVHRRYEALNPIQQACCLAKSIYVVIIMRERCFRRRDHQHRNMSQSANVASVLRAFYVRSEAVAQDIACRCALDM